MSGPTRMDFRPDPDADLTPVLEHIAAGRPLVYPTETVYGLGGAGTPGCGARVQELKGRDARQPVLVLVENAGAVPDLRWTEAARELAEAFWPGALTLVLSDPEGIFPEGVRGDPGGGVGVRVSPHPWVRRLLAAYGLPLISTSMNQSGAPPARSGSDALAVAEKMGASDILVVDWGTLPPSEPSTVLDCTGETPVVLREGSVPVGRLRCVIPEIHERAHD